MGNNFAVGFTKITAIVLIILSSIVGLLRVNPVLFPHVEKPSDTYDCDDDTLDMYRQFQTYGIKCVPVAGNLEMSGENFTQCDHVWLLVTLLDHQIAYDWGTPRFDKQHYEGYKINSDYLLYVVQQDKKDSDLMPIAGY
jgi:hypothetical protein